MPACPVSSLDPFADDFLAVPYPFYAELREAGPVVWLERYGLWACARYAEVQAALSDWQTFSSAAGLGQEGVENLLPYGAMVFNAFGPRNAHFEAVMTKAAKVVPWINAQCGREALSPTGLGAIIWAAVDTGEITAEEAPLLVRSLLS